MGAKEKAKELVVRFNKYSYCYNEGSLYIKEGDLIWNSKQCALICVDEIIKELKDIEKNEHYTYERVLYYERVKKEIEKL